MEESLPARRFIREDLGQQERLERLAARAAQGEREAFDQIYSALADELYVYVRGQCHDDAAAEDVLANVFLKAWRSAKSYRSGTGKYRAWVYAIARNELRTYWRSLHPVIPALDRDFVDDRGEGEEEGAERTRQVLLALTELTEDQRDVIILRYFGGKTHEQIAALTGRREGAVRAMHHRALRRMRKVIRNAEE